MLNWPGSYLAFSELGLAGVFAVDETPLSLSEESPFLREIHSLSGLVSEQKFNMIYLLKQI